MPRQGTSRHRAPRRSAREDRPTPPASPPTQEVLLAQAAPWQVDSAHVQKQPRLRGVVPLVLVAAVLLMAIAAAVRLHFGENSFARGADDIVQAVAAFTASGFAVWRARQSHGRFRLSWALLAAGTGSWAMGQTIWSYYEVISTRATPFPSYADIGFLLFPVLALPGLLVRPSAAFVGSGRARLVLDGLMVAASLFGVSWVTALGQVYRSATEGGLGLLVGIAYPISDLVMITVGVLVVVQARVRAGLLLLILGLVGMAIADSAFSYLTAAGSYHTGSVVDIAWVSAFLLLGVAALRDTGSETEPVSGAVSAGYLVLPYFLVAVGIAATFRQIIAGSPLILTVSAVAIIALLIRQLLTVLDNRQLAVNVAEQREELRYQAFHDTLTGLANRSLFCDRVNHALELHRRDLRTVALLFCDLDDFKIINDTLGHDAGDQVLVAIAERLRATVRAGDTVARLGGDEFAILLEDGGDPIDLSARLLDAMTAPVPLGMRRVPVRASIGITTVRADQAPTDTQELLKQADLAMYAAKRSGKATCVSWSPALNDAHVDDLDVRLELAADVLSGSLGVAYQPILLADGGLFAHEALARWRRDGVPVPPDTFIPVADRAGFLADLDMLIISTALKSTRALGPDHSISVNVGLTHLADPQLLGRIEDLLAQHDFNPRHLIVEVPEDHAIDIPEVHQTLRALRRLGIRLALDDFGVGYSSLSRIGTLNPDIIKLDRSFVAPLSEAGRHADFVAGVIGLAHRLGAVVIAEGVETADQLQTLREINCDAMQGYLLGRPQERTSAPTVPITR
jgi:diguanylate cyclase (GGDEF)-like protein